MLPDTLAHLHPRSLKHLQDRLLGFILRRLWLKVLLGMVAGIGVGVALGPSGGLVEPSVARVVTNWLALPGQLFLSLIQMIVVPLVVASIIGGMAASEDMEHLRKAGLRVAGFFLGTTAVAVAVGIAVALLIQPGLYVDSDLVQRALGGLPASSGLPATLSLETIPEQIASIVPRNPFQAGVSGNMTQMVLFSLIIGLAVVNLAPQQARPVLDLLAAIQAITMTVVRWAMFLAPVAVFGLLAQITTRVGVEVMVGVGLYVLTVLVGLVIFMVFYLLLLRLTCGKGPLPFLRAVRDVLLLAFSTSSSAAVMPVSVKAAEERLGVRPSIAQFVIPLGTTVNMAGTALYQAVATLFLAQVFGIEMGITSLLLILVLAVASSLGSSGTPGVGIVILAMLLGAVGIPTSGIALIIGVDRILDMCRTTINVTGDLVASAVMDRWVGGVTTAEAQLAAERQREERREARKAAS